MLHCTVQWLLTMVLVWEAALSTDSRAAPNSLAASVQSSSAQTLARAERNMW